MQTHLVACKAQLQLDALRLERSQGAEENTNGVPATDCVLRLAKVFVEAVLRLLRCACIACRTRGSGGQMACVGHGDGCGKGEMANSCAVKGANRRMNWCVCGHHCVARTEGAHLRARIRLVVCVGKAGAPAQWSALRRLASSKRDSPVAKVRADDKERCFVLQVRCQQFAHAILLCRRCRAHENGHNGNVMAGKTRAQCQRSLTWRPHPLPVPTPQRLF